MYMFPILNISVSLYIYVTKTTPKHQNALRYDTWFKNDNEHISTARRKESWSGNRPGACTGRLFPRAVRRAAANLSLSPHLDYQKQPQLERSMTPSY